MSFIIDSRILATKVDDEEFEAFKCSNGFHRIVLKDHYLDIVNKTGVELYHFLLGRFRLGARFKVVTYPSALR